MINITTMALDENHDTYLDDLGQIAILTGNSAVSQTVTTALSLWLGEYLYNTSLGVNYQLILGELDNTPFISAQFRQTVLGVKYVANIQNMSFKFDTKTRTFNTIINYQLTNGDVDKVTT